MDTDTMRRAALLEALRDIGEIEFWTDLLAEPQRGLFEGHQKISQALLDVWTEEIQLPLGAEPLSFLYLSRPEVNACAFKKGNYRFIGMNWGAVIVFHDLFFRMMACPTVLPQIGKPSLETAPSKHPELPVDASRLPHDFGSAFGLTVQPRDPARAAYAMHLARIALDFLLLHEMQHAAGGHLSFCDCTSTSIITELRKQPWICDYLTAHVLEHEADAAAANITLNFALRRRKSVWNVPSVAAPFLKSDRDRCTAWLFAIQTLFMLFEEATNRSTHHNHNTHPSPFLMRGYLALSVFAACGIFRSGPLPAFEFASQVFREVDVAISAISERPRGKRLVMSGVSSNRDVHMDLVLKRWLEMRPQLVELAEKNGALCTPPEIISFFAKG